jgi:hypothetical protein
LNESSAWKCGIVFCWYSPRKIWCFRRRNFCAEIVQREKAKWERDDQNAKLNGAWFFWLTVMRSDRNVCTREQTLKFF